MIMVGMKNSHCVATGSHLHIAVRPVAHGPVAVLVGTSLLCGAAGRIKGQHNRMRCVVLDDDNKRLLLAYVFTVLLTYCYLRVFLLVKSNSAVEHCDAGGSLVSCLPRPGLHPSLLRLVSCRVVVDGNTLYGPAACEQWAAPCGLGIARARLSRFVCDVRTVTESPNDAFLRMHPLLKAAHDCMCVRCG